MVVTVTFLYGHRIEVLHSIGSESSSYLHSSCDTCQRMPVTHRFAHGHDVRTEIISLKLKSPKMSPSSPETRLDFVCDKHPTS